MRKISFCIGCYLQNTLFDIENILVNRDNYAYSHYLLKQVFRQKGFDLSTYDINPIGDSDAVIYNDMPKTLPKEEDISRSYLILFESEVIKPENWDIKKHTHFRRIFTWHDDWVDGDKYLKINFSHLFPKNISKTIKHKEKLCTLIAGHKKVNHPLELYSKRIEAIRWFENNYPEDFDFYGMGWDEYTCSNKYINYCMKKSRLSKIFKPSFPSYCGAVVSKREILEKYKFAICYENARDIPGYITEKIFDCFFAGCVPIYWGANNIQVHIPQDCFIDKGKFSSYEDLYQFISNMSQGDYLNYLEAIEAYLSSEQAKIFSAQYFADLISQTIIKDLQCES